jgi:hypothetical protein
MGPLSTSAARVMARPVSRMMRSDLRKRERCSVRLRAP